MAVLLWAAGAYFAWRGIAPTGMDGGKLSLLGEERTAQRQRRQKSLWPFIMTILGLVVFFSFIVGLWVSLDVRHYVPWVKRGCGIASSSQRQAL